MPIKTNPQNSRHHSRRRQVSALSFAALSIVASACTSSDSAEAGDPPADETTSTSEAVITETTDEQSAEETVEPDRLRVAVAGIGLIDPAFIAESESAQVSRLVFEPLVDLDADLNLIPGAASSWSLADDGVTWTFVLRDDGAFSDGEPVTANDFVYAFARGADPDIASPTAYQGAPILGWDEVANGEPSGEIADEPIAGVTAIDDQTLQIVTSSPFGLLPTLMTFVLFAPVPEGTGPAGELFSAPIGNGPYMLADGGRDQEVLLARNPEWTKEPGKSAEILFVVAPTPEDSLAAFEAGEVDIARYLPSQEIERLRSSVGDRLVTDPGALLIFLDMDNATPPFDDVRYRTALSMAIDRETIIAETYAGLATPALAMVPPGSPGALVDSCKACMFDAEQARALFAEAGGAAGDTVELTYLNPDEAEAIEAIAQSWRDVLGLEVNVGFADYNLLFSGDLEPEGLISVGWVWDYPSGYSFLSPLGESGTGVTFASYSSPEFDALMAAVRSAGTVEDTIEPLQQAQALMEEDLPIIPLAFGIDAGVYSERVTNVRTNAAFLWQLEDVEIIG